jgi:hypothetical protein
MRGHKFFNFPAFDNAKKKLSDLGWVVVSPADLDRDRGWDFSSYSEDTDWSRLPPRFNLAEAFREDLIELFYCDMIYLLKGWELSEGARTELAVAKMLGLEISAEGVGLCCPSLSPATLEPTSVLEEAMRITSEDRQRDYGPPDQDFARTSAMWTAIFGSMLKDDAEFEPRHVAMAMIALKLSREANRTKRDNWVDIAGYAQCGSVCL